MPGQPPSLVYEKGRLLRALLESKQQCQVILGHAVYDWATLYPSSSGLLPPPEKMATSVSTKRGHRKGRKSARSYLLSAAGLPVSDMPHSKGRRRNGNLGCYPQLDASLAGTIYWGSPGGWKGGGNGTRLHLGLGKKVESGRRDQGK